ncbi:MAG: sigma-70 family RNA polymerase sigma factor [Deltaproteobacteria bacterium]|nr:sigma-70 family RNA polymerase sigma factor [Deltaproteobacteria bacterium]
MRGSENTRAVLERAFVGDALALEALVGRLTPIVARRVVRALVRMGREDLARQRDMTRDLTQDVFLDLFDKGAKILRDWQPSRGMSLENFVGMVAERRTLGRLGRRHYRVTETEEIEATPSTPFTGADPEEEAVARDDWRQLLDVLERKLSPIGWQMFQLLFVDERSQSEIEQETGLSRDAIYAWRSRLKKSVRAVYREAREPERSTNQGRLYLQSLGGKGG